MSSAIRSIHERFASRPVRRCHMQVDRARGRGVPRGDTAEQDEHLRKHPGPLCHRCVDLAELRADQRDFVSDLGAW